MRSIDPILLDTLQQARKSERLAKATRRRYKISVNRGGTWGTATSVLARSPEHAAEMYVRQLHGRHTLAHRTTGDTGLSGMFRAYRSTGGPGARALSSLGTTFHVVDDTYVD